MLYLLPNKLSNNAPNDLLPGVVIKVLANVRYLIAESMPQAKRYLTTFAKEHLSHIEVILLNQNSQDKVYFSLLKDLQKGINMALISDAGMPVVADPGAKLVDLAHQRSIEIDAYCGPSSILKALCLSGFQGQQFTFIGYIPVDQEKRSNMINSFYNRYKGSTLLFIETPYRNNNLLSSLIESNLHNNCELFIGLSLDSPQQKVIRKPLGLLRKHPITLGKEPAIFALRFKS